MTRLHAISQAWRSLRRHTLRSVLSTVGILLGVSILIITLAIVEGARRETLRQIKSLGASHIIIQPAPLSKAQQAMRQSRQAEGLVVDDVTALKRVLPAGSLVSALYEARLTIPNTRDHQPVSVFGIGPDYLQIRGLALNDGRSLTPRDVANRRLVAVLGDRASRSIQTADQLLGIEEAMFRIVGTLANSGNRQSQQASLLGLRNLANAVLIPISTATDRGEAVTVAEIAIKVADGYDIALTSKALDRVLKKRHGGIDDYTITLPEALIRQSSRSQILFNILSGSTALALLLVGGLGVMNTMLTSVAERTREIGIRRAVGASRQHIANQFLCEAMTLTCLGGLGGVALGLIGTEIVEDVSGWPAVTALWTIGSTFAVIALVGILAGIWPAFRAARMPPIEALRS